MNANSALTSLYRGRKSFARARLFGFPRDTYDIMKYHCRTFFHREEPLMLVSRRHSTFLLQPIFFFTGCASLASVVVFRGQGSYLYVSRLYASPVTMHIYLASSLPLSCEISYSSLMQISRGGPCPVKPERRNLELYDPPTLPSFFSRKHLETSRVP